MMMVGIDGFIVEEVAARHRRPFRAYVGQCLFYNKNTR